jgi:glycosyltransferase involved in cell wall biosynthesis
MRTLFINSRSDSRQNPGGDNTQLSKTRLSLERLGVNVIECELDQLDSPPDVDLAHVFNIQEPEAAWTVFQKIRPWGIPIVLSSIYWDMYEYWAENAMRERFLWKQLSRVLGKKQTAKRYIQWQKLKAPKDSTWKLQRQLLSIADRVLPNSVSEGELLRTTFRMDPGFLSKVDVVPNGIDLEYYDPLPEPDPSFYTAFGRRDFVLQVGSINPVKNQLGLIQALFDIPIPIVFVGKVSDAYPEYGQACRKLGTERGDVYFVDHLKYDELPGIYASAAVHALPSWRETPGLVSLEAAATGCRIVTTSIGSTRDYFGDLAWYCHPADPQTIRLAVQSALDAKPAYVLRERILSEFTWHKAGERTLASYKSLLGKSH